MIVDSSALVAMLRNEPDAPTFERAIGEAAAPRMSAANYLESSIVAESSRSAVATRRFDDLVADTHVEIVPVTRRQAEIARAAYRDYGRGSGHPARLNFGDCFAYALARDTGEPLLYKGTDFTHTDIAPALRHPS